MVGVAVVGSGPPAGAAPSGPATPQRLYATNTATTITLSWTEPATGSRPAYFRVYEGADVVARNTTTHATIRNLVFDSTHTYTVTAVDGYGRESAASATISRTALIGGPFACGVTPPGNPTISEVTASAIGFSWSNAQPFYDQPGTLFVLLDGVPVEQTTLDSARVSGLAPSSTHTVQAARRDCTGTMHPGPALTVTTAAGSPARPAAPTGLTVGTRTNSSVALSWTAPAGGAAWYAVYDGAARVAVTSGTSAVVPGLWRETTHQFTVSAFDAAGDESAQSAPAATSTLPCDPVTPVPTGVTATARSASTVALSWVSTVEATGFTVYRNGAAVTTVAGPAAVVTGLPSASTDAYAVAARTASCGLSGLSAPVTATTLAGPGARPAAPTGLRVTGTSIGSGDTGTVSLAWSQASGAAYRLCEGASVLASGTGTAVTLTLPSGPTHTVYVVAVDAAGNESTLDGPVTFSVPYLPPP